MTRSPSSASARRDWSCSRVGSLAAIALLLGGCAGPVPELFPPAPTERVKTVWVVGHGWHVGLALRRADISTRIWPESAELGPVRFIEVGWGDGEFYPAATGTSGMALKAAFWSESSVLHVAGFDPPVVEFFGGNPLVAIELSPRGFDALTRFIHQAYARDAAGRLVTVAPAVYGRGAFYLATGRYHVLTNSNSWTARALRAAGCPITPAWALTAGNVLWQVRRFGLAVSTGGSDGGFVSGSPAWATSSSSG